MAFHGNLPVAIAEVRNIVDKGGRAVFFAGTTGELERLADIFRGCGLIPHGGDIVTPGTLDDLFSWCRYTGNDIARTEQYEAQTAAFEAAYRADIDAARDPNAKMAEIEVRLNKLRSPFRSSETFWIEEIIDPRDTRPLLCEFANLSAPLRQPGASTYRMRP